jgi:diguanylate cyclase (GGDEF)-like protein
MEGTLIDITDRKTAEEQVAYQAYHDALTGLPNRMLFRDRLNQALAHTQRHSLGLAVLFLDLDHFKLINDTLGHSVGDWLLKEVAQRLKQAIREGDTVARLGGDEFTILLPEFSRSEDAAHVAQKILDIISAPLRWDNHDVYITTSIGISISPSDGSDSETLIKCADNAMYRAKELGRNNYQLWSPDLNIRVQNRLSLERSLRRAVERQEFILHYQPQFNLRTGRVTGVEALLRWPRPDTGLCYPKDFIPAAEETRLIVPIGEWLLPVACEQIREWQNKGLENLRLSVNLSAMQFQSKNLVGYLDQVLEETNFNPEHLVIELTETVAMQNVDLTLAVLHTMKRKGIKIALDDFGMGYSSLSYLKHFPIDIIKIDPSFLKDVGAGKQPEALVKAVIRLGHSLKQIIIAEGVETEVQKEFLLEEKCHEVQGFLFCRPLPPDEAWLALKQNS